MIERIEKIIKNNMEIDNIKLTPATSFKDDLDLDSFEMAQLLCALEDEFDVEIMESDYSKIETVSDLIGFIEK